MRNEKKNEKGSKDQVGVVKIFMRKPILFTKISISNGQSCGRSMVPFKVIYAFFLFFNLIEKGSINRSSLKNQVEFFTLHQKKDLHYFNFQQ